MCTVSMIYDYGRINAPGTIPNTATPLPDKEAAEAIRKFLELIDAAKKFDTASKQPDCEDPKKADFMKEVLDRLAAIEKKLGI